MRRARVARVPAVDVERLPHALGRAEPHLPQCRVRLPQCRVHAAFHPRARAAELRAFCEQRTGRVCGWVRAVIGIRWLTAYAVYLTTRHDSTPGQQTNERRQTHTHTHTAHAQSCQSARTKRTHTHKAHKRTHNTARTDTRPLAQTLARTSARKLRQRDKGSDLTFRGSGFRVQGSIFEWFRASGSGSTGSTPKG